jgi:hypothetical protein
MNLYAFSEADQPIAPSTLSAPVAGIIVRGRWDTLNPADGQYNWAQFDSNIAACKAAGKTCLLIVYTGGSTPTWIQAQRFSFELNGVKGTMPVPYEPNVLSAWAAFVAKFGQRYDADPTVIAVHLTGPTCNSAEYHMPPQYQKQAGFSDANHLAAWRSTITGFDAAFPGTMLVSDVSVVFQGGGLALRDQIAAEVAKLGTERVWFQMDHLQLGTAANDPDVTLLKSYAAEGFVIGMEQAAPATSQQAFDATDALGAQLGASYLQVYQTSSIGAK